MLVQRVSMTTSSPLFVIYVSLEEPVLNATFSPKNTGGPSPFGLMIILAKMAFFECSKFLKYSLNCETFFKVFWSIIVIAKFLWRYGIKSSNLLLFTESIMADLRDFSSSCSWGRLFSIAKITLESLKSRKNETITKINFFM